LIRKVLLCAPRWAPIVPVENKQEMSDTNVTLPQSAISSVGFIPVGICYLLVSQLGPVWTREGLPAEKTLMLKSAKNSQSQILWLRD